MLLADGSGMEGNVKKVVGIRFKKTCKIYYFDPLDIELVPGDHVIVETTRGVEFGTVSIGTREVPEEQLKNPQFKDEYDSLELEYIDKNMSLSSLTDSLTGIISGEIDADKEREDWLKKKNFQE